ncbi:alpha/beta hydrolase family protein [Streptomyces sp. NPDC055749]
MTAAHGMRYAARDADGHRALRALVVPAAAEGAVLLLHGGRSDALTPPPLLNLPGLRMRPFGSAILKASRTHGLLLATVNYRHRGWNGSRSDPVHDAVEALGQLTLLAPRRPVVLVGHSMGARAALRVAGHSDVSGVVALAPWCPPGEPVAHLRGKHVVVLHDEQDRVTDAHDSWDFVGRARDAGAQACGIAMPTGGHTMLRDAATWHRLTAYLAAGVLGTGPLLPSVTAAQSGDTTPVTADRVLQDLPGRSRRMP